MIATFVRVRDSHMKGIGADHADGRPNDVGQFYCYAIADECVRGTKVTSFSAQYGRPPHDHTRTHTGQTHAAPVGLGNETGRVQKGKAVTHHLYLYSTIHS